MREIILMSEFVDWLNNQSYNHDRSRKDIISRFQKLNERCLAKIKTTNPKCPTVWDLLSNIISNSAGAKLKYAEALFVAMMSRANQDKDAIVKKYGVANRTVDNYISALSNYYTFIIEYLKSQPNTRLKAEITTDEEADIQNVQRGTIILNYKQLLEVLKSRMGTQDRCTGDKVYLPLGLIGSMLSKAKDKKCKIKTLSDWAKEEANKVLIHTESTTFPAEKVSEMRIDTVSGIVTITVDGREYRVFNPPINGVKKPMDIHRISQTDIDHIVEIDTILHQEGDNLKGLAKLTEEYKDTQKRWSEKKQDELYKEILMTYDFESDEMKTLINEIIQDLLTISSKHQLQLSTSGWNRSDKKQAKKTSKKYNLFLPMEENKKSFFDDNEESAPLESEELSFAERVNRATIDRISEIVEKQSDRSTATKIISPRQRIVIKKLPAHVGMSTPIKENIADELGNVEIPEGWTVKQLLTTPLEKAGKTEFIAVTMLLEKVD